MSSVFDAAGPVHRHCDPRKNMNHAQTAVASRRLETSGVTIAGDFQ